METGETGRAKRGLASATEETRVRVAREGGIAPHNRRGLAAANFETVNLVKVRISSDSSKLQNMIEKGVGARGLCIIENKTHSLPLTCN